MQTIFSQIGISEIWTRLYYAHLYWFWQDVSYIFFTKTSTSLHITWFSKINEATIITKNSPDAEPLKFVPPILNLRPREQNSLTL